jgi:hypothetical protein
MKNKTLHIYHLLMLSALAGFSQTISPTVAPTQGGYVTGGNVRLQYTIGEPVNQTITGGGFEFTLGFQQPEMNLTDTITSSPFCAGSTINIPFTAQGIYGSGNIFTAQLSDSTGNFAGAISIGFDTAIISGTITATIPDSIPAGSNYKIRVISSYPLFTGGPSAIFGIRPMPVFVNDTVQRAVICPGSSTHIYVLSSQAGIQYNLMVNTTLVNAAYGNTDTLAINTGAIDSNTTFYVLATDTATGCSVQLNALNVFTIKIASPNNIAPQAVSSDTAYTFTFANVTTGYGGNQIEWSLDSNFTTSTIDTSPYNIQVKVGPNSDTLIWVRSVNSVSGCVSNAATTIGIVTYVYQLQPFNADTIITICAGTSTNIPIANSNDSLLYTLRIDTSIISSAMGNDSLLLLNTGTVSTSTVFNILTTNTFTGYTATIGFGTLIQTLAPVDSNVLIMGDTLVDYKDTIPYQAIANNGTRAIYSIASGSAGVDSVLGLVYNISSNFVVQATLYGPAGCGSATGNLPVTITVAEPPITPAPITVYIDSPQQSTVINFTGIAAGSGGDEIEWAFNNSFTSSTILASPATISLTLSGIANKIIWLRSVDSKSGMHSKPGHTVASTAVITLSAGLLDKSKWKYDSIYSDEFNYDINVPGSPTMIYPDNHFIQFMAPASVNFLDKWNLIFNYGGGQVQAADVNNIDNYNIADSKNTMKQLFDFGNCPANNTNRTSYASAPGSAHEVGFSSDGVAHLTATRLQDSLHVNFTGIVDSITYKSGILSSTYKFPLTNGMWEIRCKFPLKDNSAWPAFWNYTGHGDFTIIDDFDMGPNNMASIIKNGIFGGINGESNNDGASCGVVSAYKETPCDYVDDWHTFTAVTDSLEIIYFIDGKETYSTLIKNVETGVNWPLNFAPGSNDSSVIFIDLQVGNWAEWQTCEWQIDYFRYYTPDSVGAKGYNVFQNLSSSGKPQTLETLYNNVFTPFNEPPANDNPLIPPAAFSLSNLSQYPAQTNIVYSNTPFSPSIYYQGRFDNRCYMAVAGFGTWFEVPLVSSVADVNGALTAAGTRLYYRSTSNEIKFFQWVNQQGWAVFSTGVHCVDNGLVTFNVDMLGRLWYIDTAYNVSAWVPTGSYTGKAVEVTTDSSARAALSMYPCGCLMFYVDNNDNLIQQSWWNTWTKRGAIFNPALGSPVVNDPAHSKIYFNAFNTAGHVDIFAYNWNYNSINPGGLQEIGQTCTAYNDAFPWYNSGMSQATGVLTLSPDANTIYYLDYYNNLWYYYNDNDHGTDLLTLNTINSNWNRTPISYSSSAGSGGLWQLIPQPGRCFM